MRNSSERLLIDDLTISRELSAIDDSLASLRELLTSLVCPARGGEECTPSDVYDFLRLATSFSVDNVRDHGARRSFRFGHRISPQTVLPSLAILTLHIAFTAALVHTLFWPCGSMHRVLRRIQCPFGHSPDRRHSCDCKLTPFHAQ